MKYAIILFSMLAFSFSAYSDDGQCVAMGKVGGEDQICAKFNNTNQNACKKADGWAWCSWEPKPLGDGTAFEASCRSADDKQVVYHADDVTYTQSNGTAKTLISFPAAKTPIEAINTPCFIRELKNDISVSCQDESGKTLYDANVIFANLNDELKDKSSGLILAISFQESPKEFAQNLSCKFKAAAQDQTK